MYKLNKLILLFLGGGGGAQNRNLAQSLIFENKDFITE